MFNERGARAQARRYRARGLDSVSRGIVDLLRERGVEGGSVLEVGGGVGAVQIELLRAGASRATSVELTPTYEAAAAELLEERGLRDRVERRVVDFVAVAEEIDAADMVVMNRVVCCYADMPLLVARAADRTRGVLVMTFPKHRAWTRAVVALLNLTLRLARREFKVFVRPSERIRGAAEARGLRTLVDRAGVFWETVALVRLAA
jgi:magnesium-protoporphyrin O-methyltransferase